MTFAASGAISAACALVRLSYRSTAIPDDARPQARSRSGAFGPIVSSRSWGPEPATSTTAGNGPFPFGIERVPGRDHGAEPTVTSVSVKVSGSTYAAGEEDGEAGACPDGAGLPAGTG